MLGGGPGATPSFRFDDLGSLSFGFLYLDVGAVHHF